MSDFGNLKVYERVDAALLGSDRDLWVSLRSELLRNGGGPEAAKEYLDAEAARVKGLVKRMIEKAARGQLE